MIISKTPLRISFMGGSSDFPEYFLKETGFVLGSTIDKYVYVCLSTLPNFAEENYRFTYRITESVNQLVDFQHPVVRETLIKRQWKTPINIATMADLPGRSGLGSSSSFTVGFLNALNFFSKTHIETHQLAFQAIEIERNLLKEPGGWQDQFHAACGGFNLYEFSGPRKVEVREKIREDIHEFISSSLVLVPMKNWRESAGFASITSGLLSTSNGRKLVKDMASLAAKTAFFLQTNKPLNNRFEFLTSAMNEAWEMKRKLAGDSTNPEVIQLIKQGLRSGAESGRLCGAGGTGFILFLVNPSNRQDFIQQFQDHCAFEISFTNTGSKIVSL